MYTHAHISPIHTNRFHWVTLLYADRKQNEQHTEQRRRRQNRKTNQQQLSQPHINNQHNNRTLDWKQSIDRVFLDVDRELHARSRPKSTHCQWMPLAPMAGYAGVWSWLLGIHKNMSYMICVCVYALVAVSPVDDQCWLFQAMYTMLTLFTVNSSASLVNFLIACPTEVMKIISACGAIYPTRVLH